MKVMDLEAEINQDIDALVDLKRDVRMEISELIDPEQSLILELRYLSGKSWEEIAEATGYSVRHVARIHGRALQNFYVPVNNVRKCP